MSSFKQFLTETPDAVFDSQSKRIKDRGLLLPSVAQHAIKNAAKYTPGSDSYHKWMVVHHVAASAIPGADTDLHKSIFNSHIKAIDLKSKEGQEFKRGDSEHWIKFDSPEDKE